MHKTTCDAVMLMGSRARRGRGDSTPFYAPIDLSGAMCLPPTCGAASHDAIQVPDAPARRAHLLLGVVVVSTRLTICVLIHILFRGVPRCHCGVPAQLFLRSCTYPYVIPAPLTLRGSRGTGVPRIADHWLRPEHGACMRLRPDSRGDRGHSDWCAARCVRARRRGHCGHKVRLYAPAVLFSTVVFMSRVQIGIAIRLAAGLTSATSILFICVCVCAFLFPLDSARLISGCRRRATSRRRGKLGGALLSDDADPYAVLEGPASGA